MIPNRLERRPVEAQEDLGSARQVASAFRKLFDETVRRHGPAVANLLRMRTHRGRVEARLADATRDVTDLRRQLDRQERIWDLEESAYEKLDDLRDRVRRLRS